MPLTLPEWCRWSRLSQWRPPRRVPLLIRAFLHAGLIFTAGNPGIRMHTCEVRPPLFANPSVSISVTLTFALCGLVVNALGPRKAAAFGRGMIFLVPAIPSPYSEILSAVARPYVLYSHLSLAALWQEWSTLILGILWLGSEATRFMPYAAERFCELQPNPMISFGIIWLMMLVASILEYRYALKDNVFPLVVKSRGPSSCRSSFYRDLFPPSGSFSFHERAVARRRMLKQPPNCLPLIGQLKSELLWWFTLFAASVAPCMALFWRRYAQDPSFLEVAPIKVPALLLDYMPNRLTITGLFGRTIGVALFVCLMGESGGMILQISFTCLAFLMLKVSVTGATNAFLLAAYTPCLVTALTVKFYGYEWIGLLAAIQRIGWNLGIIVGERLSVAVDRNEQLRVTAKLMLVGMASMCIAPAFGFLANTTPEATPEEEWKQSEAICNRLNHVERQDYGARRFSGELDDVMLMLGGTGGRATGAGVICVQRRCSS